jgi:hypothetical protein
MLARALQREKIYDTSALHFHATLLQNEQRVSALVRHHRYRCRSTMVHRIEHNHHLLHAVEEAQTETLNADRHLQRA